MYNIFDRSPPATGVVFLNTEDVSSRLVRIINEAESYLWIISPYLSVNRRIKTDIEHKIEGGSVNVHVIYRHEKQNQDVREWLASMTHATVSFCEDLHAKCYFNDKEALLTSMNLYEYSQVNNYEMGIVVSREGNPKLYRQIVLEAQRILRASTTIHESARHTEGITSNRTHQSQPSAPSPQDLHESERREKVAQWRRKVRGENEQRAKVRLESADQRRGPTLPELGICIRCGESISLDPAKPYCSRCFRNWNRYKNEAYAEERCHICGKAHKTSMTKPSCRDCYAEYKDALEFSLD